MGKNTQLVVRSHAQEREWLLRLGDGNIVAGVRSLIQQANRGSTANNGSPVKKGKRRKK
jgi:hypothetical protein